MIWITANLSPADRALLSAISSKLDLLLKKEGTIMAQLDTLEAQVKANTDVEASAVTLIQGIAAALEAAKTDPVKVQALADALKASADNLSAAIVANTPTG